MRAHGNSQWARSMNRVVGTAVRRPAALCILLASITACGDNSPTAGEKNPALSESGVPARVVLAPAATILTAVGHTVQLVATVFDQDGRRIEDAALAWTSSNPSVVKVDDQGLATALINGYVHIKADTEGMSASASILVSPVPARIEVLPPEPTLGARGETIQLVYTVYDSNSVPIPNAGARWSSGDDSVATVSINGLVTAVGAGSTRITASSGGFEAGVVVTVDAER